MRLAGLLRMKKVRWALRRLYVPVDHDALVLEVGAGGNPYPRANVLLDGFEESVERQESRLVTDRPLVIGLCEKLPFRDKTFDFVIASHVLEHTDDPENFLGELQRVSKAGYIETPDAFFERINPFTYHRLEVTSDDDEIKIFKKPQWKVDSDLINLYEKKLKVNRIFQRFLREAPDPMYMRFYWDNDIHFTILNPEIDAGWDYPLEINQKNQNEKGVRTYIRRVYLKIIRNVFSQNRRNKAIDLIKLLKVCIVRWNSFD